MSPVFHILTAGLNAASAALLVYWGVGLYRLVSTSRRIPTARAGVALAEARPVRESVCAIIPAHNEEASIGALVRSLLAQDHERLRVVLCLDRCTDRTAALAREAAGGDERVRILEIGSCPEGWAGKVHAVWRGTQTEEARGADLLLFADADTEFDPSCVRATAALMRDRGLDLLSLLSTLTAERWFERLVQPAAGLELVRQYPIARANRGPGRRRRAFANGQFMLFRRGAYEAVGGHAAVKDELLEDLALARAVADAEGGRMSAGLFLADGMLSCRMYESWPAFWRGWKRIYTESAKCKVKRLVRASWCATVAGAVLPGLAMANFVWCAAMLGWGGEWASTGAVGAALSGAGLAAWGLVMGATYRIGRVPLWAVPGSIVGSWLVGRVLAEAARDLKRGVPTMWAGREYVRRAR
jgi:hypothetical protein